MLGGSICGRHVSGNDIRSISSWHGCFIQPLKQVNDVTACLICKVIDLLVSLCGSTGSLSC